MTASTDQFVDIAKRSQDVLTESVRSWTETLQGVAGQWAGNGRPQFPDAGVAVDRVFDFAEQVLSHQRELAKTVVGASQQAVDTFTDQAAKAAEQVTDHAVWNTESAAKPAAAAAEKPATGTRSRSNGGSK